MSTTAEQMHGLPHLASPRIIDILAIAQSTCFVLGMFLYISGLWIEDYYVQFAGTFIMFISNVAYAVSRLETRSLSLLLYLGMFLFWLTRPLFGITYLQDGAWFNNTATSVTFAFMAVASALLFTRLGTDVYEWVTHNRQAPNRQNSLDRPVEALRVSGSSKIRSVRLASGAVFAICFVGSIAYGYQEYSFAHTVSYEALRLYETSSYASSTLGSLGTMAPYAMCVYLATMPSKRPATIVLVLNIVTTLPSLLTGSRSLFVLAVAFLVFYYLLRAFVCNEHGWITKFEVALIVVGVPLAIFGLGMMNYLRGGREAAPDSILATFCDAFYKQGVTFHVLQYAYNTNPSLQALGFKLYTLGPLTHTITQGFIGQLFLGCELLPETNSIDLAVKGSLYAHSMSFVTHWNYLGGEGYGSSFVLEAFADFGYAGIVVISFLMGALMGFLSSRITRGGFFSIVVALIAAHKVFFLPRDAALEWLSFLWSTRFWLVIAIIAGISLVLYYHARKSTAIQSYELEQNMLTTLSSRVKQEG